MNQIRRKIKIRKIKKKEKQSKEKKEEKNITRGRRKIKIRRTIESISVFIKLPRRKQLLEELNCKYHILKSQKFLS